MPKGSWREFENSQPKAIAKTPGSTSSKANRMVRVQKMKSGKGGKTVTLISGLELNDKEAKDLLKLLKVSCGTGGTRNVDSLELQGDQVNCALKYLEKQGFRPKRSGG